MPKLPYNDKPYIRFTGKFRDLIPDGWVFNKLFASKHRCYSKFVLPDWEVTGPAIRVWQLCGGYVEMDDFLEHSYLFAQFLMNDDNVQSVKWESEKELVPGWGKQITSHEFFINLSEGYLLLPTTYAERPNSHLERSTLTDEEREALREEFYKEWKAVIVRKEMFDAALDFVRSGLSEIVVPKLSS